MTEEQSEKNIKNKKIMSNIQLKKTSEIELAAKTPKLKELKEIDLRNLLTEQIQIAYHNMGQQISTPDLMVHTNSCFNICARFHQNLCVGELKQAVLYGSIGEWKKEQETLYFSPAIFNSWIKDYRINKKAPIVIKNNQKHEVFKTHKERSEDYYLGLKNYVEKENKLPEYFPYSIVFDYLWSKKLIKISSEDAQLIRENVRGQIQEEIDHFKIKNDFKEYSRSKKLLKDEKEINMRCRKFIVVKHFEQLIY